jgi:hypothetical protein
VEPNKEVSGFRIHLKRIASSRVEDKSAKALFPDPDAIRQFKNAFHERKFAYSQRLSLQ